MKFLYEKNFQMLFQIFFQIHFHGLERSAAWQVSWPVTGGLGPQRLLCRLGCAGDRVSDIKTGRQAQPAEAVAARNQPTKSHKEEIQPSG